MSDIYNEQLFEMVSAAQMAFVNGQYHEAFNLAQEAIKLDFFSRCRSEKRILQAV